MTNFRKTPILNALEVARWAPSGDNSQPWRFKILDDYSARIRIHRDPANPYEFRDGLPVLLSIGGLLENLRLAALADGYALAWQYDGMEDSHWIVTARLTETPAKADLLLAQVTTRSVNRMPMRSTPLTAYEKQQLAESLGTDLSITWFEQRSEKRRYSAINAQATNIRLRIPEAYPIHERIFAWQGLFSETKLPLRAIPLSTPSRLMMQWVLSKWSHVQFMNRYCFGTLAPMVETDIIPGRRCAAHFAIESKTPATTPQSMIAHGMAIQRFWLALTAVGLSMQPNFSALAFGHYGVHNITFTADQKMLTKAAQMGNNLKNFLATRSVKLSDCIFSGRIGRAYPRKIESRSIRLPLEKLMD